VVAGRIAPTVAGDGVGYVVEYRLKETATIFTNIA